MTIMDQCKLLSKDTRTCWHLTTDSDEMILKLHLFHKMCDTFRPIIHAPRCAHCLQCSRFVLSQHEGIHLLLNWSFLNRSGLLTFLWHPLQTLHYNFINSTINKSTSTARLTLLFDINTIDGVSKIAYRVGTSFEFALTVRMLKKA